MERVKLNLAEMAREYQKYEKQLSKLVQEETQIKIKTKLSLQTAEKDSDA